MYPDFTQDLPASGGGYVPYFYQAGLFQLYPGRTDRQSRAAPHEAPGSLESRSESHLLPSFDSPQTVEQVIARGYFAVPGGDPTTAIISDRQHTSWLGLDDLIGQIKKRYEIYEGNIDQIQWAKCAAINMIYQHEGYSGGVAAGSKQHYAKRKAMRQLYEEERKERIELWRDVSRLRLVLLESAQSYLSSYRKVAALSDLPGGSP